MEVEKIQARFDKGYTMAIYGTHENIHEQMNNDIKELLEAINYILFLKNNNNLLCDGLCKVEPTINAKKQCIRCGNIHQH